MRNAVAMHTTVVLAALLAPATSSVSATWNRNLLEVSECTANRQCRAEFPDLSKPYCLDGTCVECKFNNQCQTAEKPICGNGVVGEVGSCVAGCYGKRHCQDDAPYCVANECKECKFNGQCPGLGSVCQSDNTCSESNNESPDPSRTCPPLTTNSRTGRTELNLKRRRPKLTDADWPWITWCADQRQQDATGTWDLYLDHNELTFIPPRVFRTLDLELLDICDNLLVSTGPGISTYAFAGLEDTLKTLYLYDNQLGEPTPLPSTSILRLINLENLKMDNNGFDAEHCADLRADVDAAIAPRTLSSFFCEEDA